MELEIKERFVISMCLPSKGTFKQFSLKKELSKKIQFSEEEIKKFNIAFDEKSNSWSWDTSVDSKVNISFTNEEQQYLKQICESALETDSEFPDEVWNTLETIYDTL